MIRVMKFKRTNGVWYVRYAVDARRVAESTKTRSESASETYRLRREMEINAGIQPVSHGELGDLIERYLAAMPPVTSKSHRTEARRSLTRFLRVCGRRRSNGSDGLRSGFEPATFGSTVRCSSSTG